MHSVSFDSVYVLEYEEFCRFCVLGITRAELKINKLKKEPKPNIEQLKKKRRLKSDCNV